MYRVTVVRTVRRGDTVREHVLPVSHPYTHLHDAYGKLEVLRRRYPAWRLEVEAVDA